MRSATWHAWCREHTHAYQDWIAYEWDRYYKTEDLATADETRSIYEDVWVRWLSQQPQTHHALDATRFEDTSLAAAWLQV